MKPGTNAKQGQTKQPVKVRGSEVLKGSLFQTNSSEYMVNFSQVSQSETKKSISAIRYLTFTKEHLSTI